MISPDKQAALRSRYNPDGSDLRKMQLRMLDMLKYIDRVCRENNIKYWLSSGTCIGAVRHGGFIPWDDDADIEMLKGDYKRLCKVLKREKSQYVLQCHSTDREYLAPYAKLRDTKSVLKESHDNDAHYAMRGIYVDIFCLEPSVSRKLTTGCGVLQIWLFRTSVIRNVFVRRMLRTVGYNLLHYVVFPFFSLAGCLERNRLRHILGSCFGAVRMRDEVSDVVRVPFEDTELPVPVNVDGYLSRIYGENYNEIPENPAESHIVKLEISD